MKNWNILKTIVRAYRMTKKSYRTAKRGYRMSKKVMKMLF